MAEVLSARVDLADFRAAIAQARERAPKAVIRSLNRSIGSVQTVMVREVSKDLAIKSGDARAAMQVDKASARTFTARLVARGKRMPLIMFGAKGPYPSRSRGRVTANTGSGRKVYPGAFIAEMPSGHRGVFVRKGRGRLPIRELAGPSIVEAFVKHADVGVARGEEQLVKNLASELQYAITRS